MNKEIMTDYYRNNPKDILNEQLADDKPYHALIQKKIAAENALRSLISEEAWKRYLNLDSVCNELEDIRLETMYLAGAADYERWVRSLGYETQVLQWKDMINKSGWNT